MDYEEETPATEAADHDDLAYRFIHGGGVVSEVNEVSICSVSFDEEFANAHVDNLLGHVKIEADANITVSLTGNELSLRFIGDFAGRAYVMRSDDIESDTTTFRARIGHGTL